MWSKKEQRKGLTNFRKRYAILFTMQYVQTEECVAFEIGMFRTTAI